MSQQITKSFWAKLAANLIIILAVVTFVSITWHQHVMASIPEITLEQIEMFTDMDEDDDGENAPVHEKG
jgi:hypothetical protein